MKSPDPKRRLVRSRFTDNKHSIYTLLTYPKRLQEHEQAERDYRFVREVERLEREGRVRSRIDLEVQIGMQRGTTLAIRRGEGRTFNTGHLARLKKLYNADFLYILLGRPDPDNSGPIRAKAGVIGKKEDLRKHEPYVHRYTSPAGWRCGPRPETQPEYYPEDPSNDLHPMKQAGERPLDADIEQAENYQQSVEALARMVRKAHADGAPFPDNLEARAQFDGQHITIITLTTGEYGSRQVWYRKNKKRMGGDNYWESLFDETSEAAEAPVLLLPVPYDLEELPLPPIEEWAAPAEFYQRREPKLSEKVERKARQLLEEAGYDLSKVILPSEKPPKQGK